MARLEELCTNASSSIKQSDLDSHNGPYPIYGAAGLIKNVDFYMQDKPYIGIVKDGAGVGRVMKLPAFSSVIGTMQYIIPNAGTNVGYLAYAMEHMNLSKYYSGATIPHIYFRDYKNELLPLHTEREQQEIAIILDKTSKLIDLRKLQLQKLDALINARFVEMFGDVIQNSKGWKQFVFSDIATSRLGKMLDAKQQTGKSSFPYLANFNVQWFRFSLERLNKMDFDEEDQKEFALIDGDLLVCEGGEIGRCAIWHNELQPCFFQKALHRVRCNMEVVLPDYLARWFQYNCEHSGFASIEGAKATIAHLPGVKLKALQVSVPPIDFQQEFVAFVTQIDKSKLPIQQSLEKLEILKQSLMQQYFGQEAGEK